MYLNTSSDHHIIFMKALTECSTLLQYVDVSAAACFFLFFFLNYYYGTMNRMGMNLIVCRCYTLSILVYNLLIDLSINYTRLTEYIV